MPEPPGRAGREVLHDDVGAGEQPLQHVARPPSDLRSSATLSLPRLSQTKWLDRPCTVAS